VAGISYLSPMKKDVIYEEFCKVAERPSRTNKVYLLMRYLRLKYRINIDKISLVKRIKDYRK
jgi:hypothetical protein